MVAGLRSVVTVLVPAVSLSVARLPLPYYTESNTMTLAGEAVADIIRSTIHTDGTASMCSVSLLSDGGSPASSVFTAMKGLETPWGVSVFKVSADGQDANVTLTQLSQMVGEARRLRVVSRCMMMVVVSDDRSFLSSFAELSFQLRLLVWSTRLLVATHLPLQELQHLHKVLASRNAMLLVTDSSSVSVRFASAPELTIAVIIMAHHDAVVIDDPSSPGGKRLTYSGPITNVIRYLAKSLNFTYRYVMPPDGSYGTKTKDGFWTGMVGLVKRQEADLAIGPLSITLTRTEAVDFTWPIWYDSSKILAGRGRLEVDPWSFLFPLEPLVWAATLGTLLVLSAVTLLEYPYLYHRRASFFLWLDDTYKFLRIFLQQIVSAGVKGWWRRLMFGAWLWATLVLTRSYSGNLMSLLAVRFSPQPYQTLRHLINDPSIVMIWQSNSINAEYLRNMKSGIIHEVADLEPKGRVTYMTPMEYMVALDALVKPGTHVLVDVGSTLRHLMAQHFTLTGQCDFYTSREGFLSYISGVISQRDNPIVAAMRNRIIALAESGTFVRWFMTNIPNATRCLNLPKKFTVRSSLSLTNLWGMYVVLGSGVAVSLLVFWLEVVSVGVLQLGEHRLGVY
ncbi:probable glutamate receptor isoform X3 [Procambarus clarkii]|uniref:probable glutamate receptor isoform X3 n=1 Tax=Procambarus clarkii TaxID=6728 RepID=UPI0037429496